MELKLLSHCQKHWHPTGCMEIKTTDLLSWLSKQSCIPFHNNSIFTPEFSEQIDQVSFFIFAFDFFVSLKFKS